MTTQFPTIYTMLQYCVYTQSPHFLSVIEWLESRCIPYDMHLNRTRFHIHNSEHLVEFLLTWVDHCAVVPANTDLATGFADTLDRDLGEL